MQLLSSTLSLLLLSLIQFTAARNIGRETVTVTETETITARQVCKTCKPCKLSTTTVTVRAPPRVTTITETVDIDPGTFQSFADKYSITCSAERVPPPATITSVKPTSVKLICPYSVTSTVTAVGCPKIKCGPEVQCPQYDAPPPRYWDCDCTSRPPNTTTRTIQCKECCGPAPTQGWVEAEYCSKQIPPEPTKMPIPTPVDPENDPQRAIEEEERKEEEPEEY